MHVLYMLQYITDPHIILSSLVLGYSGMVIILYVIGKGDILRMITSIGAFYAVISMIGYYIFNVDHIIHTQMLGNYPLMIISLGFMQIIRS